MLLKFLEDMDLTGIHTGLCLLGALLAVYLMQMTSYEDEDSVESSALRWARRSSLALLAITLLGCVLYSDAKGWQPWPPYLALVGCVVLNLFTRTMAVRSRIRRDGSRRETELPLFPFRNTVMDRNGKIGRLGS